MNLVDVSASLVFWFSILLPMFFIYYINRSERVTKNILWSLTLFIPFFTVFVMNQVLDISTYAKNPIPGLSIFVLYYFTYFVENSSNISPPSTTGMMTVIILFSAAASFLGSPYLMPYLYGSD